MKSSISKGYSLKFLIDIILMVLVVFLMLFFIGTIKVYHTETFSPNMNNNNKLVPSSFPIDEKQLLLYENYNIKKNIDVTKNSNSDIWKDYPVYPSSYKQITNNKKTWTTPDMGTCSPADFCGTPYIETEQQIHPVSKPVPIDASVTRVNWWATNTCK